MANSYATKNGRTAKRGLFVDGIWLCDCEPHLPANKFQVKNGGKNHGRWFYTCQKPQHKRCGFWLLADDAKIREASAVLNNSRSEPDAPVPPKTPQKQTFIAAPPTPQTRTSHVGTVGGRTPALKMDESFEWSSSDDKELLKAEQEVLEKTPYETPKKAPRTGIISSPGKKAFVQTTAHTAGEVDTWPLSDDVFTTPRTSHRSHGTGLLSPSITPANRSGQMDERPPEAEPSALAVEALEVLRSANSQFSARVEADLVDLLNKHDLRTQGILRGRDITRLAIHAKDKKIAELQTRIQALEAEKETARRVISHLKTDIATSPKKGKATRNIPPARRSEV